jgi:hypothetical protein
MLDDVAVERVADDLQSRLLMFRLRRYRDFGPHAMDLSLFSPRMRDLVRALVPPLANNNELSWQLWEALIDQEHNARVDRSHEPEA